MDSLPTEILGLILQWEVRMCERHKNTIVQHRLVCKAFDLALRAFAFKTVQLDFSRFLRHEATPDPDSLSNVGGICEAIHLDLMVVRDEEEISRLSSVFQGLLSKVPEMSPLLDSLRRYCMNENTFDETDFRTVVEKVVLSTPNLRRLKLNLPFQVVGQTSRTATILLATTLACIARRPEEHITLETMVLDHVSDTSVVDICNNPMDVINAVRVFEGLKHLVLQIKRAQKSGYKGPFFLRAPHALPQGPDLWIGGVGRKGEEAFWIAEDLRASTELKLDILRVTGLGYDDFQAFPDPEYPTYDFEDPTSQNRCFDQRFVDAVIKGLDPSAPVVEPATPSPHGPPHDALPGSVDLGSLLEHTQISSSGSDTARRRDWDAETFQSYHNPTSEFKRSLDGFFTNHNERALKELQNIITVADRGMMLLSAEIDRARDEGAIATQLAGNT
ncbi:hypothetical protein LZ554_004982 [Drepanopeziza brunnea f. sp. 'monogermtubi']|nr:hypothetical protein LZ554_004982 [Drepanopeziza brunnea f. sp. 'monogermtubi']